MFRNSLVVLSSLLLSVSVSAQDYSFESFPSQAVLQQINFDSHPNSEAIRDRLEMLVGRAANFAGHYILAGFGCGTACQTVTIVDVDTGDILMPTTSFEGTCYSLSSRLLIVNPYIADSYGDALPAYAYTYYYLMGDQGLELLAQTKEPYLGDCESGQ